LGGWAADITATLSSPESGNSLGGIGKGKRMNASDRQRLRTLIRSAELPITWPSSQANSPAKLILADF
jgi:hypothetical protein